jgi:Glycosyl hydrolase family 26
LTRLATENFDFFPISTPTAGTVNEDSAHDPWGPSQGGFPSGGFNIFEAVIVPVLGRRYNYRFRLNMDKLPSVSEAFFRLHDTTGNLLEGSVSPTGKVELWNPVAGAHPTGSFIHAPGTPDLVEVSLLIPAEGDGLLSWRHNGTDMVVDEEMAFRNIGVSRPRGGNVGAVASGAELFIDGFGVNDDQGAVDNTWLGIEPDPIPEVFPSYWGALIAETETTLGTEKAPYDLSDALWDEFEKDAGRSVGILHLGDPWTAEEGPVWDGYFFGGRTSEVVHERGAILMKDLGGPANVIQDVNAGVYDASIKSWAEDAKAFAHPFFLRLWWEMNGTWFPWGRQAVEGAEYVAAWRRFHDIVQEVGATNVTLIWCPNALFAGHTDPYGDEEKETESFYPGDAYVDWTGIDGYTGENPHKKLGWRTSQAVYLELYERHQAEAPDKPILVCETACSEYAINGGEPEPPKKAEWIRQLLRYTVPYALPGIRAVCWFNWYIEEGGGRIDWPIQSSESATKAFADGIDDPTYVDPAVSDFAALTKVPLPGTTGVQAHAARVSAGSSGANAVSVGGRRTKLTTLR